MVMPGACQGLYVPPVMYVLYDFHGQTHSVYAIFFIVYLFMLAFSFTASEGVLTLRVHFRPKKGTMKPAS